MLNPLRGSAGIRAPAILAYDIETIAPPTDDGSFQPWPTHQPVAVGFAQAQEVDGAWLIDIDALVVGGDVDEAALLRETDRRMSAAHVIASYNGRQFDALVLRLAAQRQRLWCLRALADHAAASRYGSEHADLADLYASFGRKVSLAAIADEVGIPVKTSVTGADVADLWAAGDLERIRIYVAEDAVATLALYWSWSAARAGDETLITRPMAALARHIEATPALHDLYAFVDSTLMWWCRPRAMHAEIKAALSRMTRKLKLEENERAFAAC